MEHEVARRGHPEAQGPVVAAVDPRGKPARDRRVHEGDNPDRAAVHAGPAEEPRVHAPGPGRLRNRERGDLGTARPGPSGLDPVPAPLADHDSRGATLDVVRHPVRGDELPGGDDSAGRLRAERLRVHERVQPAEDVPCPPDDRRGRRRCLWKRERCRTTRHEDINTPRPARPVRPVAACSARPRRDRLPTDAEGDPEPGLPASRAGEHRRRQPPAGPHRERDRPRAELAREHERAARRRRRRRGARQGLQAVRRDCRGAARRSEPGRRDDADRGTDDDGDRRGDEQALATGHFKKASGARW